MSFAADPARLEALGAWIAARLDQPWVRVTGVRLLPGGAIQENWRVSCLIGDSGSAELRDFVLRCNAAATIGSSRPLAEEFAVLSVAHQAGVLVPTPIGYCDDPAIGGRRFSLVAAVEGVGLGARIVKDAALGGDRAALAERLGLELAKIHAIRPPQPALAFLGDPPADPARATIAELRATLDRLGAARPALEWGMRWAELHAPEPAAPSLIHNDYRTGNYLVDQAGLTAILDWEFAGWGDPMADLGWFCAECWRFGRPDLEAGGVAPREAFYRGYQAGGGRVDDAAVRYWEMVAHLRWAVIALEQGERHSSGRQRSLELALTARIVPELALAIVRGTGPAAWRLAHAE
jgi:aminoglycoside phosphotransferase (APT) family kinase protein